MRAIALVGNPNCGKTTLLNALTGANLQVGNWPGVTVVRKQAVMGLPGGEEVMVNDLPGVYSLTAYGVEEKVTVEYLRGEEVDLIVNVVDGTCLERNLYLTMELRTLGVPMIVVVNLMDAVEDGGGYVDVGALGRAIGVTTVGVSAAKRTGFGLLQGHIATAPARVQDGCPEGHVPLAGFGAAPQRTLPFPDFGSHALRQYDAITQALTASSYTPPTQTESRLDDAVLHPLLAYPIFFLLLAMMFYITFGPIGGTLTRLFEQALAHIASTASQMLLSWQIPYGMRSLLVDGALMGVGGVLCFLPQILLLFLLLTILEDTGYMARAAFIADRPLKALGLGGRAFIPLLMGFGCTTSAVVSARSVDDERDRRITILLLPFMSCSAKLPVYALFGAAFFAAHQTGMVLGLYLTGMVVMALVGAVLNKLQRSVATPFVLELPPYRPPQFGSVLKRVRLRAKEFIVRAGTLIFVMSMVIWLLQSITPTLGWAHTGEESIFGRLGQWISPLFAPLGFSDWRKCVALMSGLVAKEAVVSTLAVLYRASDAAQLPSIMSQYFTPASAASFLVFTLLYPPCLSAMAAMRRELQSRKLMWLSVAIQVGVAYVLAFFVYQVGSMVM